MLWLMSQARLPDGSRIVRASLAAREAVVRRVLSVDSVVDELRAYTTHGGVMSELRSLDGGGQGRSDAEELLRRIAAGLADGSFIWELPANTFQSALRAVPSTAADVPKAPTSREGTTVRASLFTGGTTFRKAEPPKKPKVRPKLALEYAVVVLRSPDATRVECSFEQDPAAPAYDKGLRLSIKGTGDVEAFADEALTMKLDLSAPAPGKVYLKGMKAGLFELKLDVEEDPRFERGEPAKAAMAVVELNLGLHKQDVGAIGRLQANPDQDPVSKYHDDLKALKLPEQIEVTEAEKADGTRWLHVQRDGSHARAKLVLRKLDPAAWPPGCDDYRITLEAKEPKVAFYDVEWDGAPLPKPHAFKVSALKAADKTLWVEGLEASAALGDVRLTLGLDRSPGGVDKKPKREGDVACLTVVEITEVKVDYTAPPGEATAWDERRGRFYINLKPDSEGREIILRASVKPPLPGVPIHFMLAPDSNNRKAANWGVDLPSTWIWKDIDAAVKHCDRHQRTHLYGFSGRTDANGVAQAAVILSRIGGDIFHPAAYISQDPHLTRYVRGVPELEKRKPTFAPGSVQVWRKFWYQEVTVEGVAVSSIQSTVAKLRKHKIDAEVLPPYVIPRPVADSVQPPVIYPRFMVGTKGDFSAGLVVGDISIRQLWPSYLAAPEHPVKLLSMVCTAYWQADGVTAPVDVREPVSAFPLSYTVSKRVIDPPLQGGGLLVNGDWISAEWDSSLLGGKGAWTNYRSGSMGPSEVSIDPQRGEDHKAILISLPTALVGAPPHTQVWIRKLSLKGAISYLGSYYLKRSRMSCVDSPRQLDLEDNALHELGHAFKQVPQPGAQVNGAPKHPHQYTLSGSHCNWSTDRCVMYDSGGARNPLHGFCEACLPYLLSEDLSSLA